MHHGRAHGRGGLPAVSGFFTKCALDYLGKAFGYFRRPVPKRQPRRLSRELEQRILAARELAKAGPLIVASQLGLPASTVWKVLRRCGVSRLQLPAREPVGRYGRARPGELLHVDIKKLGRFWTLGKRVLGNEAGTRNRYAG